MTNPFANTNRPTSNEPSPRYVELTIEQRDELVKRASSATYADRNIDGIELSVWENYGKRRLYIRFKNGYQQKSDWLDLNDPNDLTIDIETTKHAVDSMRAFLASLEAESADNDTDNTDNTTEAQPVVLDTIQISALIRHYRGIQGSLYAADDDEFTKRGVQMGYIERFGVESARLTEKGRQWVEANLL
jgi:hypothetical protein